MAETPLPRYFFHVRRKSGSVVRDRVGIDFRNLSFAKAGVTEAVRQITMAASDPVVIDGVEISDQAGRVLAVVSFDADLSAPTLQ